MIKEQIASNNRKKQNNNIPYKSNYKVPITLPISNNTRIGSNIEDIRLWGNSIVNYADCINSSAKLRDYNAKKIVALWKSVILQGLIDLASRSSKKMAKINRIKSLMWFNISNQDFQQVCTNACLDSEYVHKKALQIKKNNPLVIKVHKHTYPTQK